MNNESSPFAVDGREKLCTGKWDCVISCGAAFPALIKKHKDALNGIALNIARFAFCSSSLQKFFW